uniref:Glycine cleavage system P protein n=1 Tax=Paramoeba aestuarina TaxID=180227 RepID=A0A6U3D4T8_9EUKA
MCDEIGVASVEQLISKAIPDDIRYDIRPYVSRVKGETETLQELFSIARQNEVFKNFIGMGYHDSHIPPVLIRNVLQSPQWYTPYTPYQPEISQGRLETLMNYQTMISDLTGLPFSNASLLDEATAAGEALSMSLHQKHSSHDVFVSELCHPQTISVVQTRMGALGVHVHIGDHNTFDFTNNPVRAALVQYPATDGSISDFRELREKLTQTKSLLICGTDLLSLTLLTPPGEFGADIAYGCSQRFGLPLGGGGPHAAYLACSQDLIRVLPGRIIGRSLDSRGKPALRMALQTREQHIRRERATSNICTSQALLATVSGLYACYHGKEGLVSMATHVLKQNFALRTCLRQLGDQIAARTFEASPHLPVPKGVFEVVHNDNNVFDTTQVMCGSEYLADKVIKTAAEHRMNFRRYSKESISITLDETTTMDHLKTLVYVFAEAYTSGDPDADLDLPDIEKIFGDLTNEEVAYPEPFNRKSDFLSHEVFHLYRTETQMMRYLHHLASKDYGLQTGMIPLGSCTMKLNAAAEMLPMLWRKFGGIHPFAPPEQMQGYRQLFGEMETMLATVTGFAGCTLQPNAGSQGEFTGLMMIRKYHEQRGEPQRNICLIPTSAHGTNPASVATAGMKVASVKCDPGGNVCMADLKEKAEKHQENLAALMITYPSTHGVFEEDIREACDIIHTYGGQVYMDGANMNAQCGLTSPGFIGADMCHLNLHKTFCIPHGGGGPGMGPLCVAAHLIPYLPTHSIQSPVLYDKLSIGAVSAAPRGSASILPISWMYLKLMGMQGMATASQIAILNANYMAARLKDTFPILYTNKEGYVGHEFILDVRHLKKRAGVEAIDIAKRLQDYGFHAPTLSFPVANTLMIEPTESETLSEIDRFIEAILQINEEVKEIEAGVYSNTDNVLKNAPHVIEECISSEWDKPYPREKAAFPVDSLKTKKFWPSVKRLNEVEGDKHLKAKRTPGDLAWLPDA